MKNRFQKSYIAVFIIGVLLIAVYKTFDNFGVIIDWFNKLLKILAPFGWGFAIALLLYPLCIKFETLFHKCKNNFVRKNRRGFAVALTFVAVLGIFGAIIYFLIPPLVKNIGDFVYQVPALIERMTDYVNSLDIVKIDLDYLEKLVSVDNIMKYVKFESINQYASGVMGFSTAFVNVFMGLIISVYVLLDRDRLKNTAKRFFKIAVRENTYNKVSRCAKMATEFIYKYLYCLLIDAVAVFILSFIVLTILKVKYAHIFALMLGIFNLIPYFGAIIATALTAIVTCFTANLMKGVWVAVALIILQQVDANVIQPNLVNNSFSIKPFWVIFAILVGGGFFGIAGILLAVPIAALIKTLLCEYMDKKEAERAEKQTS